MTVLIFLILLAILLLALLKRWEVTHKLEQTLCPLTIIVPKSPDFNFTNFA